MAVYKDLNQPIGLRMEAAKAALPYEKLWLASTETKIVDEFENMSIEELDAWLDEHAEARVKVRHCLAGIYAMTLLIHPDRDRNRARPLDRRAGHASQRLQSRQRLAHRAGNARPAGSGLGSGD